MRLLWDRDIATHPNFDENYGYVDDRMILVDIGDIRIGPGAVAHDVERQLVIRHPAFQKLQAKHPSLADYLKIVARQRLFS